MPAPLLLLLIATPLEDGMRALSEFRLDDAIAQLEEARREGHHRYGDWVLVHEQLGIAYAYKAREAEAIDTFERLLLLDPTHALRYNLSPKATLPFEQARERARVKPRLAIDVLWPRDADADQALPLSVEVISNPGQLLRTASLHYRRRGEREYRRIDLDLAGGRGAASIAPPVAPDADVFDQIFLVARDEYGNEVLEWADEVRPREILLRYHPPALYQQWWFWVLAGAVVTAGSVTTYSLTRPKSTVYDLEVHP